MAKLEKTIDDLEGKMSPPALRPSFLGRHWTHHPPVGLDSVWPEGGDGQEFWEQRGWMLQRLVWEQRPGV